MSIADPPERSQKTRSAPAPTRSAQWAVVGVVAFALFMDYLIYGLIIPLTPYSPAVGGAGQVGLLYGGYSVGVLAATPLFGYLGDRIGYREPLLLGVLLLAATAALFALATNFTLLLLGRLLQGAAASATWTAGLALIAARYPKKRVEMIGYALMGSTAGSLLGPVGGGALYQAGGYLLPFAVSGVLVAIDAGLCVCLLPRERGHLGARPDLPALLRDRSVRVAAAAVVLAAIGWGIVEPLLPARLDRLGVSPAAVGLIFTIGSIAYGLSAPLVSRVADRLPVRTVIIAGTIAMAAALPLLGLFHSALGAAAGFCLVSVCYAFMLNPTSAELGNAVDRRGLSCYAAVYAVYNIAYAVGQMGASAFASAASPRLSFFHTMLVIGVALLVFAPVLALKDAAPAGTASPLSVAQTDREHPI